MARNVKKAAPEKQEGDDDAETRVLDKGDNGPSEQDKLFHFNECSSAKSDLDSANGVYRNKLKAADEAGVNTAALKRVLTVSRKSIEDIAFAYRDELDLLRIVGKGPQMDLFDTSAISRLGQIFEEGFQVGIAGKEVLKNDKFKPDSIEWETFANGWHTGQKVNSSKIGRAPEPAAPVVH